MKLTGQLSLACGSFGQLLGWLPSKMLGMQVYELYVCALSMGNVYSLHINHTSALGSHPPLHHQQALTLHAKFVTFQKP